MPTLIFANHGYPWLIHRLAYRRRGHANLHVRGYIEKGTTTTPFDMAMLNDLDRFRPFADALHRVGEGAGQYSAVVDELLERRVRAREYTREHGEDDPAISGWRPTPQDLRPADGSPPSPGVLAPPVTRLPRRRRARQRRDRGTWETGSRPLTVTHPSAR